MMRRLLDYRVRRWLYGIAIAFVPLAVWLGWITPEAAPLVLPLVLAIFNVRDTSVLEAEAYNGHE